MRRQNYNNPAQKHHNNTEIGSPISPQRGSWAKWRAEKPDISAIASRLEALLDESIAGGEITAPIRVDGDGLFDLSRLDIERRRAMFAAGNRPLFEIGQAIVARYAGEIMIRELCASDLKDIVLRRKPPERSTAIARVGA